MWWIIIIVLGVMLYFFTGFTLWGLLCLGWFAFFRWLAEESYHSFVVVFCYVMAVLPFIPLTIAYPIPALPILGLLILIGGIIFYLEKRDEIKAKRAAKAKKAEEQRLEKEQKERRKKLVTTFNNIYSLPLPEQWEIADDTTECIVKKYVESSSNCDKSNKRAWYDLKLRAFYDVSIAAECEPMVIKSPFDGFTTHADNIILRQDIDEDIILGKQETDIEKVLKYCIVLLKDDKLTPYRNKLKEIANKDTSFWGLSEKEKTEQLHAVLTNAQTEFKEMQDLAKRINIILDKVRIFAYKNIYLGVELINFNRENSGGKSLTTEKSIADITNIKFYNLNINSNDLQFNTIVSFASGALNTLGAIGSNKNLIKFAEKNPKMAGVGLLVGGVLSVIEARNEAIENNLRMQKEIVKRFDKLIDQYIKNKGQLLRIIEIAKSITEANKGFIATYVPLRNKVFVDRQTLSMEDMQAIALVTSEYRKISMSKL